MATLTKGHTFASGDTVTATKLNDLVDSATISGIVDENIDASAAIAASKLALSGAIGPTELATGAVTGAAGGGKLAASAITGQTLLTDALASGDEFLVHDTSESALRRVAFSSLQPAGSIIQTVATSQNLASTLKSTSIADSTLTPVSLTRKQANSKILLTLNGGRYFSTSGYIISTYFYASQNGGAYANVSSLGSTKVEHIEHDGSQDHGNHSASFIYTPASSITTIAFKVYYSVSNDDGNWHIANTEPFFMSITEISA